MPQALSQIDLDEVSMVERGANQGSKIVLMKRADDEPVHKATTGIQFVVGFKEAGGSEVQSVIFSTDNWDEDKAKVWLKAHNMTSDKVDKPASGDTLRFRQADPGDFIRFRVITPGAQVAKALSAALPGQESFQRIQDAIVAALKERYEPKPPANGVLDYKACVYARDFFDDSVIFEQDGQMYRADYELDQDAAGKLVATIGERVPVEVVYQDVGKADTPKKTEAGHDFPAEAYAYAPAKFKPGTWAIRLWETPTDKETAAQVGRAVTAMDRADIPADALVAVKATVLAAWRKTHPDAKPADVPAVLKKEDSIMDLTPIQQRLEKLASRTTSLVSRLAKHRVSR